MIFRCGTLKYILYTSLYIIWQKSCTLLCLATINKKKMHISSSFYSWDVHVHFVRISLKIIANMYSYIFCAHGTFGAYHVIQSCAFCVMFALILSLFILFCHCIVCLDSVLIVPSLMSESMIFFFKICTRPKQKYICVYCHPFDKHLVGR